MKKTINAKIIADSKDSRGNRITSYILTYPRMIHSELMTHRMFSRNAASSRAIPFAKMVKAIEEDPFIPIAWQKDHKGMQGTEYIEDPKFITPIWLEARDRAVKLAKELSYEGVTKQLCNRLLEPFQWMTTLVTATEYDNFFELRCPKYKEITHQGLRYYKSKKDLLEDWDEYKESDLNWYRINQSQAEIHIQALAEAMWDAKNENEPVELKAGEWHIPFGDRFEGAEIHGLYEKYRLHSPEVALRFNLNEYDQDIVGNWKIKIATARCARLSYMTFDGEIDYEKDIKLHDMLLKSKHLSPFEHCAKVISDEEYDSFIKGYHLNDIDANIKDSEDKDVYINWIPTSKEGVKHHMLIDKGWCNNFRGFIPYRYLIENNLV